MGEYPRYLRLKRNTGQVGSYLYRFPSVTVALPSSHRVDCIMAGVIQDRCRSPRLLRRRPLSSAGGIQAESGEKQESHRCPSVDKTHPPPVHRVPLQHVPIHLGPEASHAVQVSDVCHQQREHDRLPDSEVGGGAQHEGLVDGDEEVEVGELGEQDGGREGDGGLPRGGRPEMCELQISQRAEVGEEGSGERRHGLDEQEKERVEAGEGERWGRHLGVRCDCGNGAR